VFLIQGGDEKDEVARGVYIVRVGVGFHKENVWGHR